MKKPLFLRRALLIFGLLIPLALAFAESDPYTIQFYSAYGGAQNIRVEGRVLKERPAPAASEKDGKWRNLRRSSRQFFNDEGKNLMLDVSLGETHWTSKTDDEGYFQLVVARPKATPDGWQTLRAASDKISGEGRLLLVPAENMLGLISDIDDTILVSDVLNKRRLLANTFLKNPAQRQAVPGMAELYQSVLARNPEPASAALFYLSASPSQIAGSLTDFLARQNFPPGVLLTKQINREVDKDSLFATMEYKIGRIETIFADLPQQRFILVGDDSEKDPETYDAIRSRYPERVEAIWIRRVNPDPKRARFAEQLDLQDVLVKADSAK